MITNNVLIYYNNLSPIFKTVRAKLIPNDLFTFTLSVRTNANITKFQRNFPQNADYLIVPTVHDNQEPHLLNFIKQQATLGTNIIGIYDNVLPLAHTNLLHKHRATKH